MKKLVATALFSCAFIGAMAQGSENSDQNNKAMKGPYETNRFWNNWFIEFGVGPTVYLGGQNGKDIKDRITPVFDLGVGKWITPSVGTRMQFNYAPSMRQYSNSYTSPFAQWDVESDGHKLQKFNFMNLHADFMWNLSTALCGYNEKRVYQMIPYVGLGWGQVSYDGAPTDNELTANVGIINKFRVSKRIDINLELRSAIVNSRFDHSNMISNRVDAPVAATLGMTFKLGKKTTFKRAASYVAPDYSSYTHRIQELERVNTSLTNVNQQLVNENEALRNRKPETVSEGTTVSASPVALFFSLGKATLDNKELTNLAFYVKNAMKADQNKIFTLIGSADSATGSKEVNQRLSEQRMQYVYDLLVNKYGISKDRLIKKAEGDTNNRFAEPALNRVVIVE